MLEGIFEINSYEIDDLLGYIKTTSNEVEETNDEAKETFEPNKKSEVFGKGAQTINDQMDEILNQIDDLGNVMQKGTSAIFETEMKILEEARDLQIPEGYETNEVVTDKHATAVSLTKNDGTSVNEGTLGEKVEENTVSEIEKEALEDIEKGQTEEQSLDESQLQVNEVGMKDITGVETQAQEYNENGYSENEQNLADISQNEAPQEIKAEVEINETGKVNLEDMEVNSNTPEEQEIKFGEENINPNQGIN